VAVFGVIDLIGVATLVPHHDAGTSADDAVGPTWRRELSGFTNAQLWLALATTMLSQAGLYTAYTYIAPLLTDTTGFSAGWVAPLLALFGVGTFLGSLAGGRLADKSLMATLCLGLVGLTAILAVFTLTAQNQAAMVVTLFLFGVAAFVINPALQTRVMNLAHAAPTLASTSNISAFNLGNAFGPWVGGLGISAGAGLLAPSWIGAALALAALAVTGISVLIDRRTRPQ
jgi:MFS transporter, DHA1 family, inner membrane transport protein